MTDEPVSDPDALVPFIESTTGSVYNIIDVRERRYKKRSHSKYLLEFLCSHSI